MVKGESLLINFRRVLLPLLLILLWAGVARSGEIRLLTPAADSIIYSRNRNINVVVAVSDKADIGRVGLSDSRRGSMFNPLGRWEKNGLTYVHFRVPLRRGRNVLSLAPVSREIRIRYFPVSSLLNVDYSRPDIFLFHRAEEVPAECGGCHTDKLPDSAKVGRVIYGRYSPNCYSCHPKTAAAGEWRHFPAANLLCKSCHEKPGEKKITVPDGKVEEICFRCHINDRKWRKDSHIHGPVGTGDCTICHDPHNGNFRGQLWADGNGELCVACHADMKRFIQPGQKRFYVHGILQARGCNICHSPHASNHRFQLTDEINDLCVSCHTGLADLKRGHPVANHPLKDRPDPRRSGRKMSCTSCHDPHGSKFKYLLIADVRGGRICVECHKGKKGMIIGRGRR